MSPDLLLVGIGLALLIPLLPYMFELIALRRLPTALFGVIMSLEPAIAALLGFLILDQDLRTTGIVAIAMVSIASAGATLSSRTPPVDEEAPALSA
jgi:inner membrane transporter RhtA